MWKANKAVQENSWLTRRKRTTSDSGVVELLPVPQHCCRSSSPMGVCCQHSGGAAPEGTPSPPISKAGNNGDAYSPQLPNRSVLVISSLSGELYSRLLSLLRDK